MQTPAELTICLMNKDTPFPLSPPRPKPFDLRFDDASDDDCRRWDTMIYDGRKWRLAVRSSLHTEGPQWEKEMEPVRRSVEAFGYFLKASRLRELAARMGYKITDPICAGRIKMWMRRRAELLAPPPPDLPDDTPLSALDAEGLAHVNKGLWLYAGCQLEKTPHGFFLKQGEISWGSSAVAFLPSEVALAESCTLSELFACAAAFDDNATPV